MSIKDCCQKSENLEERPSGRADTTLRVCKVCGCRHFDVVVDPGQYKAKLNA